MGVDDEDGSNCTEAGEAMNRDGMRDVSEGTRLDGDKDSRVVHTGKANRVNLDGTCERDNGVDYGGGKPIFYGKVFYV